MKAHLYAFLMLFAFGAPLFALAATESAGFVPLTKNAPFLVGAGNADTLPTFLNNLYKICIGAAAVLAVLQIMRAGVIYMGGDSITEKKDAKNLIRDSIAGLILVLSPVIVFSIINPDILSLKIGGIKELAPGQGSATTADATPAAPTGSGDACTDYSSVTLLSGTSCDIAGEGWKKAADSCCSAPESGYICCGKPK